MKSSNLNQFWRKIFGVIRKLIFIVLIISTINFVNAEEVSDCNLVPAFVQWGKINLPSSILSRYSQLYSQNDLEVAFTHLWSYCCQQKLAKNYCADSNNLPSEVPESPYFFDHLVDLGFRKLDWDPAVSYQSILLDSWGAEWRKSITDLATSAEWSKPEQILAYFQKYRKPENLFKDGSQLGCSNFSLKPSSQAWLANRYLQVCSAAACIVQDGAFTTLWFGVTRSDTIKNNCESMAFDRYKREVDYVESVSLYQSSKILADGFHSYMSDYFLQNRRVTLMEKFADMDSSFATVVQKVMEWTKQCSL